MAAAAGPSSVPRTDTAAIAMTALPRLNRPGNRSGTGVVAPAVTAAPPAAVQDGTGRASPHSHSDRSPLVFKPRPHRGHVAVSPDHPAPADTLGHGVAITVTP
jgi:hypothetical protein